MASIVLRTLDGEQTTGLCDDMALRYLTDEAIYRQRSREIYVSFRAGVPPAKIARKYRICTKYVYQLIREMPGEEKERIDGFAFCMG